MGRGLSDQQLQILRMADDRRRQRQLEPVLWNVCLLQDVPEPLAKAYAETMRRLYRIFVPERKIDVYFNPELRIRSIDDVAGHLHDAIFMTKNEHKELATQIGSDWVEDLLVAKLHGEGGLDTDFGSSVLEHLWNACVVARFRLRQLLGKSGCDGVKLSGTFPIFWAGRFVVKFRVHEDLTAHAEAERLCAPLREALGPETALIMYNIPKVWHVTINALMAELCGLRQYALHDDDLNGGRAFDHAAVSPERLNQARATITRACARLEQRHLIVRTGEREIYQSAAIALSTDGVRELDVRVSAERPAA